MTDVGSTQFGVRDEQLDALCDRLRADPDPVEFDDLRATASDDGETFAIETPAVRHGGLSESELRAVASEGDVAPYVTNWYYWEEVVGHRGRHRRAFLRHAEAAREHAVPERYDALESGMETEWGEIVVTATLASAGRRRYEIRHADDAGVETGELDAHGDPLEAREIATYDDRGRYRPLKTAPSLVSGWVFSDLDGRDAVETLDVNVLIHRVVVDGSSHAVEVSCWQNPFFRIIEGKTCTESFEISFKSFCWHSFPAAVILKSVCDTLIIY